MNSGLSIPDASLREFGEALFLYEKATKKDTVDILNRAALNIAYRAAQFTPIANGAEIRSELFRDPHLVAALTSLSLKKQGIGTLAGPLFEKEMEKFVTRRVGSKRYLRSGWAPAIIALGGTFRGAKLSRGIDGYADKATPVLLLAEIAAILDESNEKTAESAERVGEKALIEAIDFVANDMMTYANDRLADTARRHSG